MDNLEFRMLSLEEKGELVFQRGEFLISMMYYGHKSNLYSYQNLFIEVKIGHDTEGIESIDVVEGKDLDRFLNQIALPK